MEAELKLERVPKGSKLSQRQHLMQVYKTTGRKPKQLEELPPCPEEVRYLWNWFLELVSDARLSYTEISNWSDLTRQPVKAWEVDVLKTLDRIYWRMRNGD